MSMQQLSEVGTKSSSSIISTFASNSHLVGPTWILVSALSSTYFNTKFLKFRPTVRDKQYHHGIKSIERRESSFLKGVTQRSSLPEMLTLYRFAGSFLIGHLVHPNFFQLMDRFRETGNAVRHFAISALCLFVANLSNSVALSKIGISLTYTTKCGIPLVTVLLTLLLDGISAMPSIQTLMTLIPIAFGIALASWDTPAYNQAGFIAAITSCTAQAALNVSSKKALTKTGMSGMEAQRVMATIALFISVAIKWKDMLVERKEDDEAIHPPLWIMLGAVLSYHIEYALSFMFVNLVEPISFGTTDAIRRLAVVISGRHMFGERDFSYLNYLGVGLALAGVLAYSISLPHT